MKRYCFRGEANSREGQLAIKVLPNFIILLLTLLCLGGLTSCSKAKRETASNSTSEVFGIQPGLQLTKEEQLLKDELHEVEEELYGNGLFFLEGINGLEMRVRGDYWGRPSAYYMEVIEEFIEDTEGILETIEKEYEEGQNPFSINIDRLDLAKDVLEQLVFSYPSIESLSKSEE